MTDRQNNMKAVALRTGLSLSSVSRALDPMRAHTVKQATRERILNAARELHIAPNVSARRLRLSCSETVTAIFYNGAWKNPNFSFEFDNIGTMQEDMFQLGTLLRSRGWELKIEYVDTDHPLDSRVFDRSRTDGILFYGHFDDACRMNLQKSGLPGVLMSRIQSAETISGISKARLDSKTGYRQAIDFLRKEGVRKVGRIAASSRTEYNWMVLESLLQENGLSVSEDCQQIKSYFDLHAVAEKLAGMDAVFCRNDVIANWLLREFRSRKWKRIPRIIGYDNDPGFSGGKREFDTVGVPGNTIPQLSLSILLELIRHPNQPLDRFDIVVPTDYLPAGNPEPNSSRFVAQTLKTLKIQPVFQQK